MIFCRYPHVKTYIFCVLVFLSCPNFNAQQDSQFTQYFFTTQVINPGYIGSRDFASAGLIARSQWVNFEGAPRTGTLTFSTPLGRLQKMAVGFTALQDAIGPVTQSLFTADYAYNLYITENNRVSFGIKPGLSLFNLDLNKLNLDDPNDVFRYADQTQLNPHLGLGIYYASERFYAGLSVSNLLGSITSGNGLPDTATSSYSPYKRAHYYLMTGYVLDLNSNLKFKPASLLKAVRGAPLQWDVSANFLYNEKLLLGASYRWSAAWSAVAGFQLMDPIFMGVAYDYQTTELQQYSNGSYELILVFNLGTSECGCSLKKRFF